MPFRTPSVGLLLVTGFLSVFALANFEATISWTVSGMLGWERSSSQILLFFAYIGLVQSIVQGVIVRQVASRIGESAMTWIGGSLSILGYVLLALAANPEHGSLGQLWWASAVEVSGIAFLLPAIQSLISRRTDPGKQGGVLGIAESFSAMARIGGAAIGVELYHTIATLPFWTAGGVICLAMVLASVALGRGRDWSGS